MWCTECAPSHNIQYFTTACQHLFLHAHSVHSYLLLPCSIWILSLARSLFMVFTHNARVTLLLSLSPSLHAALSRRCSVHFFFFFLVGNVSYYGTHFLLKTVDFVIHLCCGLGHLIPWAYSQFMSFLTSSAACWCQVPLCPFHIARVLKSSLSSLPLTPCAALLVSFWAKMGMNFHSFLQSHF